MDVLVQTPFVPAGQLSLALLSVLPVTRRRFQDAVEAYAGSFSGKGIFSSSFGPFLLGIGMTLAGAVKHPTLPQNYEDKKCCLFMQADFVNVQVSSLVVCLPSVPRDGFGASRIIHQKLR